MGNMQDVLKFLQTSRLAQIPLQTRKLQPRQSCHSCSFVCLHDNGTYGKCHGDIDECAHGCGDACRAVLLEDVMAHLRHREMAKVNAECLRAAKRKQCHAKFPAE